MNSNPEAGGDVNYGSQRAYQSMHEYHNNTKKVVAMRINSLDKLSYGHKTILSKVGYLSHLKSIERCSETNQVFLQNVLDSGESHFQNPTSGSSTSEGHPYSNDYKRIQNIFHSLYFEWSLGGKPLRDKIFNKIKEKLKALNLSNNPKVLVPGAALCRLPYSLSLEFPTHEVIACESSLINVLVSNYILNYCDGKNPYSIYPWITDFINNASAESVLKPSFIPDVSQKASFELLGGDFGNLSHAHHIRNSMDVVITQFFIDSSTNILDLASCVQLALKNEGYWINLGPLNYGRGTLLELSFDILRDIIIDIGFELIEDSDIISSNVAQNPDSMMSAEFKSVMFVCKCIKNKA